MPISVTKVLWLQWTVKGTIFICFQNQYSLLSIYAAPSGGKLKIGHRWCSNLGHNKMPIVLLVNMWVGRYQIKRSWAWIPYYWIDIICCKIVLVFAKAENNWKSAKDGTLFFKILAITGLFFFIFVFSKQLTVSNVQYNFCWWLDSNCGLLVSVPTESQPLPQWIAHF